VPGASIEAVTGRLGVGAIAFLGLFLIVDGAQLGAFEMIETYGKSVSWGIVGIIPTAVVIYIVGVFCFGIAELLLTRFAAFRGVEPKDILALSRGGGPVLQQAYGDQIRTHELLKGAAVSFLVLAGGSLSEFPNMQGREALTWLGAVGAFALSVMSLVFSNRAIVQARSLAKIANE
jgi:hypothetical protein